MKKTFILLAILFIICAAFTPKNTTSSTFTVTFGQQFNYPLKHNDLGIIGNSTDGIIQVSHKVGSDITLQKFDIKYNLLTNNEIALTNMPSSYKPDNIIYLNNKTIFFYSTLDKKQNAETLFMQEVDIKNAKLLQAKEVLNLQKLTRLGSKLVDHDNFNSGRYAFNISPDSSKILIIYSLELDKKEKNDVIGFAVFDKNMRKLWSKEVTMPNTNDMMDLIDYTIDNQGNAYLLAKTYDVPRKNYKEFDLVSNHHYSVLKVTNEGIAKSTKIILNNPGQTAKILADNTGNIICADIFANKPFLAKIDPNGSVMSQRTSELKIEAPVIKNKKQYDANAQKTSADNLELREIVLNEDGSKLLIGEQYCWYTVTKGENMQITCYRYDDINVIHYTPNGEIDWIRTIPKLALGTSGHSTLSFHFEKYKGDYYFFYFESDENLNLPNDQELKEYYSGKPGLLMYTKINATGATDKGILFNGKEKDIHLRPTDLKRISESEIVGRVFDGRESNIVSIRLNYINYLLIQYSKKISAHNYISFKFN